MRSFAALLLVLLATQDKDRLRTSLKDTEVKGDWIYDDLPAGFQRAKASGKPLFVVLRCVP